MFNFLHTYSPQPIIFSLGPFSIYWYGLLIVIGILVGLWLTIKLGRRYGISSDDIFELVLYLIVFGLLGGRLYYLFLELDYYLINPLDVFKIWQGGLAIHGVLIGGIITLIVWTKKKKYFPLLTRGGIPPNGSTFWQWADLLAPAIILGQAIGRWGNYFNQELFGWPTNLPWGIPIDQVNRPFQFINNNFFHPTFLYESLADLLVFLILIFLHKKQKLKSGSIFLIYLILYSVVRFIMEFWRIDSTYNFGFLRWPQVISLVIIILVMIFFIKRRRIDI